MPGLTSRPFDNLHLYLEFFCFLQKKATDFDPMAESIPFDAGVLATAKINDPPMTGFLLMDGKFQ